MCSRKFNQFRLDVTAFIQIPNLNRISLSRLPMITKLTLVITHCKVKFILKSLPDKRNKNPASYKFNWADESPKKAPKIASKKSKNFQIS